MASPRTKPLLLNLTRSELTSWCADRGQAAYRADQIRRWIFGKRVSSIDDMHDVPSSLRRALMDDFDLFSSDVQAHQVSKDGTEKLLLILPDGSDVECVLMREEDRRTVCLSTQVGCAMGCIFCASGLLGVKRNLTTGEILEQILRLDRLLPIEERITNVVIMGMGEPLANLNALIPALLTLNEKGGLGLGARRITVSTVGLPDKMRELAKTEIPFNLAVSLHAPNDELRSRIVPVNRNIGIAAILEAAEEYFDKTGRRVTYEYVLLADVNDEIAQAKELVRLLKGRNAHVNLIPMNSVSTIALEAPGAPSTGRFLETLLAGGVNATVRKRKGADIDAACGQLRLQQQARPVNVELA
ncbi:MAG: 23S rRNA (adenine(2503)-C(2))-methyltransferase RlmN [Planctomycetaceae bacterium]|nr:23S rRNA (adenine(2503)-C(2))-methyltransferase RlmN [Planctomycetaceae bacterium]